jgi:hypothetical protein
VKTRTKKKVVESDTFLEDAAVQSNPSNLAGVVIQVICLDNHQGLPAGAQVYCAVDMVGQAFQTKPVPIVDDEMCFWKTEFSAVFLQEKLTATGHAAASICVDVFLLVGAQLSPQLLGSACIRCQSVPLTPESRWFAVVNEGEVSPPSPAHRWPNTDATDESGEPRVLLRMQAVSDVSRAIGPLHQKLDGSLKTQSARKGGGYLTVDVRAAEGLLTSELSSEGHGEQGSVCSFAVVQFGKERVQLGEPVLHSVSHSPNNWLLSPS